MENKYLYIIDNVDLLKELKGSNIAFPLKSFSIGFNNYFNLEDIIYKNAFLFINRLLSSVELDNLKSLLVSIPKNIKGIFFEDIGVYEVIKDLDIEKIYAGLHLLTNYKSINSYLQYVDSALISPDITLLETNEILKHSNKELCIFGYGHLNLSYSRRLLNKGYSDYFNIEYINNLEISNTDYKFIVNENEDGSVIYDKLVYNALEEDFYNNIKYVLINTYNDSLNSKDYTKGFLDRKTIYKLVKGTKNV